EPAAGRRAREHHARPGEPVPRSPRRPPSPRPPPPRLVEESKIKIIIPNEAGASPTASRRASEARTHLLQRTDRKSLSEGPAWATGRGPRVGGRKVAATKT